MAIINTGAVERTIIGKHDANFVHPLGDELITNGDFATDSDWQKQTGWNISNGKANAISAPHLSRLTQVDLGQNINRLYKVTFTISNLTEGGFKVWFGTSQSDDILNDGSYVIYLTPTTTQQFFIYTDGVTTGSIDNVSVKEVLVNRESTVTNTGAVEREIEASHDANFVHPLGDELITNGGFDTDSDWTKGSAWIIANGQASYDASGIAPITSATTSIVSGKTYELKFKINTGGFARLNFTNDSSQVLFEPNGNSVNNFDSGEYTFYLSAQNNSTALKIFAYNNSSGTSFSIDNVSVKEVLINRESDITNTGVTIRDIEGINESDEMFPDNTQSSVLNVGEEILPLLESLESRATYYENEENTINILKNLNC